MEKKQTMARRCASLGLFALFALIVALGLFGGRTAYAADGADEAGDGDAATGTTHISWSVVDSFSGNTLENAKITITAASNGAETVLDTADLQSSTIALLNGDSYTVKTERANYTTHTETIAVSKDGTPTYASKPGKTDADYKAALISAERRKVTYKAVFEKGPAPKHIDFMLYSVYNPQKIREYAVLNAESNWTHLFDLPQYVDGSSQYYNDVYFGDDDANINGPFIMDGNVYALMDTNYDKDVVTYTFHYIRKATDIDTGAKPQKEVPGATLQLLDETGTKVIKEWVTDENPLTFTLTEGNYILRETKRPWDTTSTPICASL